MRLAGSGLRANYENSSTTVIHYRVYKSIYPTEGCRLSKLKRTTSRLFYAVQGDLGVTGPEKTGLNGRPEGLIAIGRPSEGSNPKK